VDPVPDPLLLRKSGSAGNPAQTSGSVASNTGIFPHSAVMRSVPAKTICSSFCLLSFFLIPVLYIASVRDA
jgi:hypothetical protein